MVEVENDKIREDGFVGYAVEDIRINRISYAEYYLQRCWNDSELKNKADMTVYKQLLEIDSKLGTSQSEQLFGCVFHSLRNDLIQV